MASATKESNVVEIPAVKLEGLPAAPAGMRYKTIRGKKGYVELGEDGKPKVVRKTTKVKQPKPEYPMPVDESGKVVKIRTAESTFKTFKLGMAKLRDADFSDPWQYALWEVWYCERLLERAKTREKQVKDSGATPEERSAAKSGQKQADQALSFIDKLAAMPNSAAKSAAKQRLEAALAALAAS